MTTNTKLVELDADYRRTPDYTRPFCIRCQKPVDPTTAIQCTEVGEFPALVKLGGLDFIGKDCAKIIGLV